MSTKPRTLILAGTKPGGGSVGQILLRDMLSILDPSEFIIAAFLSQNEIESFESEDLTDLEVKPFLRPPESDGKQKSRWRRLRNGLNRICSHEPRARKLAQEVNEWRRQYPISRVWTILNTSIVNDVSYYLLNELKVPWLAHVWDDMEHLCAQRHYDYLTKKRTLARFEKVLQHADRTAVICEAMAEVYTTRYNASCSIIRHGLKNNVVCRSEYTSDSEFRIGFSGGMYSDSAWRTLFDALAQLNWKIAGKTIRLVVMSANIQLRSRTAANVDYLGWRDTADVHHELSKCDLLYLPQPFEGHQRSLSQLSFPTKLSTYAAVGRPILVHAPVYGSLTTFYNKHPLGGLCNSLLSDDLANSILSLAGDSAYYSNSAQQVAHVATHILSRSSFERQVREFLDIPHPHQDENESSRYMGKVS